VNARLEQLLGYLDRPEVTEIVVGVGRAIAIKSSNGYMPLTAMAVTQAQLDMLIRGTPLDGLLAAGPAHPVDCAIGRWRLRVEVAGQGEQSALRVQLAPRGEDSAHAATPPVTKFASTIAMAKVATPAAPPPELQEPVPAAPTEEDRASPREPAALTPEHLAEHGSSELVDERTDVSMVTGLVRAARQLGASDLHIAANRAPKIRVKGELRDLEGNEPMMSDLADRVLLPLLGPSLRLELSRRGYVDLAFDVPDGGRIRANISRQQGGLRGAFRLVRAAPPTLDELGLPRELGKAAAHHQGLVVIAGPNGHGKTTTMAALVDLINTAKPYHIITIEDPIEIVHPRKLAVLSQREVGRHTKSFGAALKASLREDPDVIVIGELRDRETVEIALTAAETGHLVFATMSTPSAAKTIDRLIDMFPPEDRTQARASIAGALKAIIAQRLLPGRGAGVVPAVEMVTGVLPLAVMIRDDKLYQLPNLMQRGRAFGMIRFDDSVHDLLRAGKIGEDVARTNSFARPGKRE